jgi:hypothetical protein
MLAITCTDRTYHMEYGSCNSKVVPPTALFTTSRPGTAPSVTVTPQAPYLPGVTVVIVTPTNGAPSCGATVTVVPCKVKCHSARVIAHMPPLKSTTSCTLPDMDLPDMIDHNSTGTTMVEMIRSPPGPYPIGSTSVTFTAVYAGGVESLSATCTLTVSAPAAAPLVVDSKHACIWRHNASTKEYCFKPADLAAVTGGDDPCNSAHHARISRLRCGAGPGTGCSRSVRTSSIPSSGASSASTRDSTSLGSPRAAGGVTAAVEPPAAALAESQSQKRRRLLLGPVPSSTIAAENSFGEVLTAEAVVAAGSGRESAARHLKGSRESNWRYYGSPWYVFQMPHWFEKHQGAFRYTWLDSWYICPKTPAARFQAVGNNCRVSTSGMVCVHFDDAVPMQLVIVQETVTGYKSTSSRVMNFTIAMWNPASATRPNGLPSYCIGA